MPFTPRPLGTAHGADHAALVGHPDLEFYGTVRDGYQGHCGAQENGATAAGQADRPARSAQGAPQCHERQGTDLL